MKAQAIKSFTMGSSHYKLNQVITTLEDDRVKRLVGEGLVIVIDHVADAQPLVSSEPAAVVSKPLADPVISAGKTEKQAANKSNKTKKTK